MFSPGQTLVSSVDHNVHCSRAQTRDQHLASVITLATSRLGALRTRLTPASHHKRTRGALSGTLSQSPWTHCTRAPNKKSRCAQVTKFEKLCPSTRQAPLPQPPFGPVGPGSPLRPWPALWPDAIGQAKRTHRHSRNVAAPTSSRQWHTRRRRRRRRQARCRQH
jgi:hypothetical protein